MPSMERKGMERVYETEISLRDSRMGLMHRVNVSSGRSIVYQQEKRSGQNQHSHCSQDDFMKPEDRQQFHRGELSEVEIQS